MRVATANVGPCLHAFEDLDVALLSRAPGRAGLDEELWTLRSDTFPDLWEGIEVQPKFRTDRETRRVLLCDWNPLAVLGPVAGMDKGHDRGPGLKTVPEFRGAR